jgi:hypothetical protein
MRTVDLGTCCTDCFNAINFDAAKLGVESIEGAMRAGKKLSRMADLEQVQSLHTGDAVGFSSCSCLCCDNELAGERYEIYGLQNRKDTA